VLPNCGADAAEPSVGVTTPLRGCNRRPSAAAVERARKKNVRSFGERFGIDAVT